MAHKLTLSIAVLLLGAIFFAGFQWVKTSVAREVYRDRLEGLHQEYAQLAEQYNQAITPKPVTELLVKDGRISVVIRDGTGKQTLPTPYHADREVFVDYALIDGRLLIRRVFDEATAPRYATPIDEDLLEVDWDSPGAMYGKVIYRRLDDGRWVISVTGDGSLGLARLDDDQHPELTARPTVREYSPVALPDSTAPEHISLGDVWRHLLDR